jgi:hypothetical protein
VGRFTSLHGEYCANVVHVAGTTAVDGITLDNTSGGPSTTTVIRITNSSSQNIVALNTVLNTATNALVNVGTGKTIAPASGKLALYVLGDGATKTEFSSYSGTNSVVNSLALLGGLNLNGNVLQDGTTGASISDIRRLAQYRATLTTTAAASDNVAITGVTASSKCTLSPTNATAATDSTSTYISAKTTDQITVTHPANASRTWDILCTNN